MVMDKSRASSMNELILDRSLTTHDPVTIAEREKDSLVIVAV
jgi:hypothetical protein